MGRQVRFPATALEDTLIYLIPYPVFQDLFDNHDVFADFVEVEDKSRLRQAVTRSDQVNDSMTAKVSRLISRQPVTAPSTVRLQEAARIMTDNRVSSLLLVEGSGDDEGNLVGIITDRDLRTRAVADALPSETPVADIMSPDLITIRPDALVFEAMLQMLHNNVHHLPVIEKGKPRGVVALSDIVKYESQNSLYVVSNIHRQPDVKGLKAISQEVRNSFIRMVNEDANSHMIGSAMAGIGRSFTQRLLELERRNLARHRCPTVSSPWGPWPGMSSLLSPTRITPWYWMTVSTRLSTTPTSSPWQSSSAMAWPNAAMPTAPAISWRPTPSGGSLKVWKDYFTDWIDNPKAEALLNSNIFFDLDGVYGEERYAEALKELIAEKAQNSQRFLAMLARNALNRTPPLGFFRQFVMEEDGKQQKTFNLKRRGTAPVSDLIRVHALACGSRAQNSFDRLRDIGKTRLLPEDGVGNLRDAMEFIAIVRIRHQALAMEDGREPDNNVRPEDLSPSSAAT